MDKNEAATKYVKFINEVEIESGLYENKRLKIRENPGFLTKINIDSFTSNIYTRRTIAGDFVVTNIHHIN